MSLQAPPSCPLLTFAASPTSAHSLLSTGKDPRCVNNADTLQDLVGHLGTLEPVFILNSSAESQSHINDDKTSSGRSVLFETLSVQEEKNVNHVKNSYQRSQCDPRSRLETALSTTPHPSH